MYQKSMFSSLILYLFAFAVGHQIENCRQLYKVYVYDITKSLSQNSESARKDRTFHVCKKCIYEQFALEYVINDYFTGQDFCGRTLNPEEADFFYLPIIRDVDYRIALQSGQRAPSLIDSALINAIEKNDTTEWKSVFNVTDKFWHRFSGADHIIVMPAPVTNLRHQTSMRGFFHYMIQLNPPIFVNVEQSRSFVNEYPICATQKNIVVPYPTTDPDLYTGSLYQTGYPQHQRDKLIFYHGGHHGECTPIRKILGEITSNKKYAIQRGDRKREMGFQSAVFCPIPIGDSPSSKRMYDVLNFGCIPVVVSDDLVWAFSYLAGGSMDTTLFALHLPQNIVQKSASFLLEHTVKGEQDINYGRPLPSTGTSLYSLLQSLAEEEKHGSDKGKGAGAETVVSDIPVHLKDRGRRVKPEQTPAQPVGGVPTTEGSLLTKSAQLAAAFLAMDRKLTQTDMNGGNHRCRDASAASIILEELNELPLFFTPPLNSNSDNNISYYGNDRNSNSNSNSHIYSDSINHREVSAGTSIPEDRPIVHNERRALQPSKKQKQAQAAASAGSNTLIRLLQKIPAADVTLLQQGVQQAALLYNFYKHTNSSAAFTAAPFTSSATPMVYKPQNGVDPVLWSNFHSNSNEGRPLDKQVALTAEYWFPDGGAMRMLDEMMIRRKRQGTTALLQKCRRERLAKGHKYVGRYPCEKNRL